MVREKPLFLLFCDFFLTFYLSNMMKMRIRFHTKMSWIRNTQSNCEDKLSCRKVKLCRFKWKPSREEHKTISVAVELLTLSQHVGSVRRYSVGLIQMFLITVGTGTPTYTINEQRRNTNAITELRMYSFQQPERMGPLGKPPALPSTSTLF
jgi:hypothetical protein